MFVLYIKIVMGNCNQDKRQQGEKNQEFQEVHQDY